MFNMYLKAAVFLKTAYIILMQTFFYKSNAAILEREAQTFVFHIVVDSTFTNNVSLNRINQINCSDASVTMIVYQRLKDGSLYTVANNSWHQPSHIFETSFNIQLAPTLLIFDSSLYVGLNNS